MGEIRLLEEHVIDKIAAGEVVERPASIVKELIENGLDAGATQIDVTVDEGGRRTIVVRDNGKGIAADDLPLAVRRHATSKVRTAEDLTVVRTMGFRGEALAAVGGIATLCISSRQNSLPATPGATITVVGGGVGATRPWDGPAGTTVVVSEIFASVPARLAFLKSPASEYAHISELVDAMAHCHPRIGFTLTHNGREQKRYGGTTTTSPARASGEAVDERPFFGEEVLTLRAKQVLGEKVAAHLQYVCHRDSLIRMEGLFSTPGHEKMHARDMFFAVNGRWVKDKVLRYAVLRGYHSHLMKGKYPVAVLHLGIDPTLVDVNVHPAKTEVRFQYADRLQNCIALPIRSMLRGGHWAAPSSGPPSPSVDVLSTTPPPRQSATAFAPPPFRGQPAARPFSAANSLAEASAVPMDNKRAAAALFSESDAPVGYFVRASVPRFENSETVESSIPWHELRRVGSFANCYLFFENRVRGSQLLVVDQHAFHERIIYERMVHDRGMLARRQRLLMPEIVDIPASAAESLQTHAVAWHALGFAWEALGPNFVTINEVPVILAKRSIPDVIAALAATLPRAGATAELAHETLSTMACHAAVRAGEDLTENEIQGLLAEAGKVNFFHNCPHGRRVFKFWAKSEVAAWFDR